MNRKKDYRDLKRHRETCRKQHKRYYGKTAFLYEGRSGLQLKTTWSWRIQSRIPSYRNRSSGPWGRYRGGDGS